MKKSNEITSLVFMWPPSRRRPELKKAMWVSEKLLKKVEQVSIHILLLTEGLEASSSGLEKRHLVQLRKEEKKTEKKGERWYQANDLWNSLLNGCAGSGGLRGICHRQSEKMLEQGREQDHDSLWRSTDLGPNPMPQTCIVDDKVESGTWLCSPQKSQ